MGADGAGQRCCAWCESPLPVGGFAVYKLLPLLAESEYLCGSCHADAVTDESEAEASELSSSSQGDHPSSDSEDDYESLEAGSGDEREDVHAHVHKRRA